MANRNATFAKRQRETDLKDRAKAKEERRAQKRGEVRENKGPQIAWGEAVHAVTDDENETPSPESANQSAQHDARSDNQDAAPAPGGAGSHTPPPNAGPRRAG